MFYFFIILIDASSNLLLHFQKGNFRSWFLRVDERNSDSYVGRYGSFGFIFTGKVLKFVQFQNYFFAV